MVLLASTPPLVSWAGPDFKPNLFQPFKILAKKAGKMVVKQYGTYVLVLPSCSTTYVEVSCFFTRKVWWENFIIHKVFSSFFKS